ncbi:Uncharacterised protein [Mycobacteroides abscessus subsp. abscessus]|nr:Uncharacterised protein [Mycobacteroides abscessus subsp. abscessus]
MYDLVAATASSGPASTSMWCSAAVANGERAALVTATVKAPCWRATVSVWTRSGEPPDWLTPMTSTPERSGRAP